MTPAFKARVLMEDRGRALALWDHAMREGQPAGTLPIEPMELAVIAECHRNRAEGETLIEHCLPDWSRTICRSLDGEREIHRLAHPVFQAMAVEAWAKRQHLADMQAEKVRNNRLGGLRRTMQQAGMAHMDVRRVAEWLEANGCKKWDRARVTEACEAVSAEIP